MYAPRFMFRYALILALLAASLPGDARVSNSRKPRRQGKGSAQRVVQEPPVTFDAAAVNNPATAEPLGPESKGSAVLRAQVLLARQHFSCGEIDGLFGRNFHHAVAAFQRARGLPGGGLFGPETWAALQGDTAPALLAYAIAPEDVAGPFVKIPNDMMQKAKLPSLNYESPLEALAEKFHCSPKLLQQLNPDKNFGSPGEQILVPNAIVLPPGKAARVEVSRSDSSVSAFDSSGRMISWYTASTGSEYDPLPVGNWVIRGVRRNPVFMYNPELFWDARPGHTKARIAAGPNGPVGTVWIDLSKEHYGIHGTPEPSKIGYTQSHGCIRLTNWDAWELASMVEPNTPAILKE